MELNTIESLCFIPDGAYGGIVGMGNRLKSFRQFAQRIAVTHPHIRRFFNAGKDSVLRIDNQLGTSEFSSSGFVNFTAKLEGHQLKSVTYTQDRYAQVEESFIGNRRVARVDARGPPGEYNALWVKRSNFLERDIVWMDFTIDMKLAHPTGNQLRVLGAIIKDEDAFYIRH